MELDGIQPDRFQPGQLFRQAFAANHPFPDRNLHASRPPPIRLICVFVRDPNPTDSVTRSIASGHDVRLSDSRVTMPVPPDTVRYGHPAQE